MKLVKAVTASSLSLLALLALVEPAVSADPPSDAGFQRRCAVCHSLAPAKGKVGPPLKGVIGRTAGTAPGYDYSPAMKSAAFVWNREKLDTYIRDTQVFLPGVKMEVTVSDPALRQAIIDYLVAQSVSR